jgi:hypothetical protein
VVQPAVKGSDASLVSGLTKSDAHYRDQHANVYFSLVESKTLQVSSLPQWVSQDAEGGLDGLE